MIGPTRYADRAEAGRALAEEILRTLDPSLLGGRDELDPSPGVVGPVVLALPRGGVPVAAPLAQALGVAVSVLVVRKLGAPGEPELAIGALAAIGDRIEQVINTDLIRRLGLSEHRMSRLVERETALLRDRVAVFGSAPPVAGRAVILVDDGLATGATMRVAVTAVRRAGASYVVAAAPVGASAACQELERLADDVVCPLRPEPFRAVGEHYVDFTQTTDSEVLEVLGRS
ncbi:MAG: phosphoribosyltransferase family protein [Microlunatus sp.]